MLTTSDVMAGKILVQLGLAPAELVREHLRAIDRDGSNDRDAGVERDLVNRLTAARALDERAIALVRHRVALYQHVRSESSYVRGLEQLVKVPKSIVAELLATLERSAFRRRIGELLVARSGITREQDAALATGAIAAIAREDARIVDRYRKEDFAGVAKPLIPGTRLEPQDFKISTLFRSKETQARVATARDLLEDEPPAASATAPAVASDPEVPQTPGAAPVTPAPGDADEPKPGETVTVNDLEALAADETTEEEPAPPTDMESVRALKRIGAYRVVEVLGVGGMGAVFLGQKDGRGEFAAIKVMLDAAADQEERGRFRREIELTKGLQHPNVINVLDSGTTAQGLSYLVVPALAGKELRALLKQSGERGLPPELACRIFEQILEGLDAVHAARIVHRDLKPENVFVLAGGKHEIKIMDFGLAKLEDEADPGAEKAYFARVTSKLSKKVLGSPAYIAPESVSGDPVDRRTDIYSLGIMFFEMLTGLRPLESDSPQDYLIQHLVAPPLTLGDARPERKWPRDLDHLLSRMLAKTREERPPSCGAILSELRCGLRDTIVRELSHDPKAAKPDVGGAWGGAGLLGRLLGRKGK